MCGAEGEMKEFSLLEKMQVAIMEVRRNMYDECLLFRIVMLVPY